MSGSDSGDTHKSTYKSTPIHTNEYRFDRVVGRKQKRYEALDDVKETMPTQWLEELERFEDENRKNLVKLMGITEETRELQARELEHLDDWYVRLFLPRLRAATPVHPKDILYVARATLEHIKQDINAYFNNVIAKQELAHADVEALLEASTQKAKHWRDRIAAEGSVAVYESFKTAREESALPVGTAGESSQTLTVSLQGEWVMRDHERAKMLMHPMIGAFIDTFPEDVLLAAFQRVIVDTEEYAFYIWPEDIVTLTFTSAPDIASAHASVSPARTFRDNLRRYFSRRVEIEGSHAAMLFEYFFANAAVQYEGLRGLAAMTMTMATTLTTTDQLKPSELDMSKRLAEAEMESALQFDIDGGRKKKKHRKAKKEVIHLSKKKTRARSQTRTQTQNRSRNRSCSRSQSRSCGRTSASGSGRKNKETKLV